MCRRDMMATSKGLLVIVCWILMTNGGAVCPDGYCRHSDGCYRTVALNVTWIDARSYCEVLGGALLSPVSQSMAAAAEGALRRMKGTIYPGKFWLDITDLLDPKDWKRMSDNKALNFTNWDTTCGDSTSEVGARNCVYMSESLDYRWVAASCIETIISSASMPGKQRKLPTTTERYFAGTTRVYDDYEEEWTIQDVYMHSDINPPDVYC